MPLKPVISKLEDVEENIRSLYEPELDKEGKSTGKFIVSIAKEGGYELHNSEALLNALQSERGTVSELQSQLKSFDGVDPKQYQSLAHELEQLKKSNPKEQEIEELVNQRVEPLKAEITNQLEVYKSEASQKLEEKDSAISSYETQLTKLLVSDKAISIASSISDSPDLLAPHIERHLKADLSEGKASTVFVDSSGNRRISKIDIHKHMDEEEFIADFKKNKQYAPLIRSEVKPGSGPTNPNNPNPSIGSVKFSEAKSMEDKKAAIGQRVANGGGG